MADSKSSTPSLAMVATSMVEALSGPLLTAPHALIVHLDSSGNLQHQPVGNGQSLMRLDELQDHLNARPLSAEFLADLRDYCQGRLDAQAEARATSGFVIPRGAARWEIAHVNVFQPVTVGGAQ